VGAALLAAALTLGLTGWITRRYDRDFAFRIARTTALYIAAVTPPPPPPPPPRRRRPTTGRALPTPTPPAPAPRGYYLPALLTQSRALTTLPGWTSEVEIYYGTAPLVDATAPPLTPDDLADLDTAGGRWRDGVAIVALRDREGRDLVGAVAAHPKSLPRGPVPGGVGFTILAALVAVGGAAAIVFRKLPLRRGGYAFAALLLGVAAYVDVRGAARQSTDRWLTDTRRLLIEAATRMPQPRARVAVEDLVALVKDAELVTGEPGESAPRRVKIDGQRRAVVAVLIGPGRWVELRTVPAEDATLLWLPVLLACAYVGPLGIWTVRWAERTPPRQRRETAIGWGFLGPSGLHLLVFTIGPLVFALYLGLHPAPNAAGWGNFAAAVRDPITLVSLRKTAIYALYVPLSIVLALAIAVMVHDVRHWGGRLLRTLLLMPYVASAVAIALVWQLIYQSGSLGLGRSDWLSDPRRALLALMLLSLWAQVGGQATVFLAGLQRIPRAYHDAAEVDGANAWRRFWRITFPLLRPVTAFVFVTGMISAFQLFTFVYVLTGGGPMPQRATESIVHQIYQIAWGQHAFGIASSMAVFLFLLLLIFTAVQLRLLGRWVEHA